MRRIIAGAREGSSAVCAGEGLAVGDGEQVGAEPVDLGEQPGLGGGGEAEHGDDRGDADGDPERGQRGAELAGAQPDAGRARGQVGGRSRAAAGRRAPGARS